MEHFHPHSAPDTPQPTYPTNTIIISRSSHLHSKPFFPFGGLDDSLVLSAIVAGNVFVCFCVQTLEKDKLELLADANSSRARASALEEKYSAARVRCERGEGRKAYL